MKSVIKRKGVEYILGQDGIVHKYPLIRTWSTYSQRVRFWNFKRTFWAKKLFSKLTWYNNKFPQFKFSPFYKPDLFLDRAVLVSKLHSNVGTGFFQKYCWALIDYLSENPILADTIISDQGLALKAYLKKLFESRYVYDLLDRFNQVFLFKSNSFFSSKFIKGIMIGLKKHFRSGGGLFLLAIFLVKASPMLIYRKFKYRWKVEYKLWRLKNNWRILLILKWIRNAFKRRRFDWNVKNLIRIINITIKGRGPLLVEKRFHSIPHG